MSVEILATADVLHIYWRLVAEFAESVDPISPPGVKSEALLESAVSRQHVGLGTQLKYSTVHQSAATLMYGICCDHPFHNGNKRTALVAMLAHLDKNKRTLFKVSERDLYNLIIEVANHSFGLREEPRKKPSAQMRRAADDEVDAIADWIYKHMYRVERGERQITFRELKRILGGFGYNLENPNKNSIDVVKREVRLKGLIRKTEVIETKRITSIGYPRETEFVPIGTLKHIRRVCKLTEEDGIDSLAFYDEEAVIDAFINKHRTVLRRLARR